MLDLILDSLPLALGISLSPLAIVAVVVLVGQGNRRGAAWFLAGWLAGLTVLTTLIALFGESMRPQERNAVRPWLAPLEIVVGVAVVVWVVATFLRKRNAPPPSELPRVLQSVDKLGPAQSFGMATLMAGVNAKNITFLLLFGLALVSSSRPFVLTVAFVVSFIVIASVTIAVPVFYALIRGDAAEPTLEKWRAWMIAHQSSIMHGFLGVVGLALIWRGVTA